MMDPLFCHCCSYNYYHYYYNKHLSDEIGCVQSDMRVDDKLLMNQGN